jgi:dTDP-glucose 4,6-dehydratase
MIAIITGGGGFIGLNLVEHLAMAGLYDSILIFDKAGKGFNADGLISIRKKYSGIIFVQADVVGDALEQLVKTLPNLEIHIYHLAAESHVDRSLESPRDFFMSNVIGTVDTLEVARKNPHVRLLVVSTDEVYGDQGPFPTPLSSPIKASSPYSAAKAGGDVAVEAYRRSYGLKVKLSRCCNNFGRYQDGEKFIPTILRHIKAGTAIPVYGNGLQTRQWVPATEHANRLVNFMLSDDLDMHVGGVTITNLDLIGKIAKLSGQLVKFESVPDRAGHDIKYELLDTSAISEELFTNSLSKYVSEVLNE